MPRECLKVLEGKREIKHARDLLRKALQAVESERYKAKIRYRGGSHKVMVSYSKKYDMWWCLHPTLIVGDGVAKRLRYWNSFGVGRPREKAINRIAVEINMPEEGIYRRTAGVFAKDKKGNIYLLHRGGIRGGKKGVGKKLFFELYTGPKACIDDGIRSEAALIGRITSKTLLENLRGFISMVGHIRKSAAMGRLSPIRKQLRKLLIP